MGGGKERSPGFEDSRSSGRSNLPSAIELRTNWRRRVGEGGEGRRDRGGEGEGDAGAAAGADTRRRKEAGARAREVEIDRGEGFLGFQEGAGGWKEGEGRE